MTPCTTASKSRCVSQAVTYDILVHNVTLKHQRNVVTAVPVVFSVTYPTDEPAVRMPLLMLFNGASVEEYWYRRVIARLASKGYVVITSDYYRPYTVPIPNLPSDARSAMAYSSKLHFACNTCYLQVLIVHISSCGPHAARS